MSDEEDHKSEDTCVWPSKPSDELFYEAAKKLSEKRCEAQSNTSIPSTTLQQHPQHKCMK